MRSAVVSCLLLIASISALPQTDVAPTQDLSVELLFKHYIEELIRLIRKNEMDPFSKERHDFEHVMIDGLVKVEGFFESLEFIGLSNIVMKHVHYNVFFGRLEFHICLPELSLSVGKHVVRGVIGDRGGELVVAGSVKVCDICLRGDAFLLLEPGTVTIIDINVNFSVGSITSNLRVVWKSLGCLKPRDLSQRVNNFFNWKIPLFLDKYYYVINTIIGEGIRRLVNCFLQN